MTVQLAGSLEWFAAAFAAFNLLYSARLDHLRPVGRAFMYLMFVVHLALIPLFMRGQGPFVNRDWRFTAMLGAVFLLPWLLIFLLDPAAGRLLPNQTPPLTTYSGGVWVLLAFYPWLPERTRYPHIVYELGLFAVFYANLVAASGFYGGDHSWDGRQVRIAAFTSLWLVIAVFLGKGFAAICRRASVLQAQAEQDRFNEFVNFLHSDVKAGIAAVEFSLPDADTSRDKLRELTATISRNRIQMLFLLQERISLAQLVSEHVRVFSGLIKIESSRVGSTTVPHAIGNLLNHALGDLISNSLKNSAGQVSVEISLDGGAAMLEVLDDGPGLDSTILENRQTSLYRLRAAARQIGGDLVLLSERQESGTRLRLVAPLAGSGGAHA